MVGASTKHHLQKSIHRRLLRLAFIHDASTLQKIEHGGKRQFYSHYSHDQFVLEYVEQIGIAGPGYNGTTTLLVDVRDLDEVADRIMDAGQNFDRVLEVLLSTGFYNGFLNNDLDEQYGKRISFETRCNPWRSREIQAEVDALVSELADLGYAEVVNPSDGAALFRWTDKIGDAMRANYIWPALEAGSQPTC